MKQLLRHPVAQAVVTTVAASYLRLVYATLRVTQEGREARNSVLVQPSRGVVFCIWHESIPLCLRSWPVSEGRVHQMRGLISRSLDGQLIAGVFNRLGTGAIRGSKAQEAARGPEKGGAEALRDMVRWVRRGGGMVVTPDGPRGPARVMGEGPGVLARLSGGPVLLLGTATRPAIRLPTWDGSRIPLPFGRAAFVWDGPFEVGADDDLAAVTADWQARLTRVNERAEALLA